MRKPITDPSVVSCLYIVLDITIDGNFSLLKIFASCLGGENFTDENFFASK